MTSAWWPKWPSAWWYTVVVAVEEVCRGAVRASALSLYAGPAAVDPAAGRCAVGRRASRLADPGTVPSLKEAIPGCLFARCAHATERCHREYPPLELKAPGHTVACWEADRL